MSSRFFISGNGTDVGKTIVSACLVHALKADYWKPIQAGGLEHSDAHLIRGLCGNSIGNIHPSTFNLTEPMSPHAAADIDGVEINLHDLTVPATENSLIVEGAGGLLVPINRKDTILDVARRLQMPMILVCANYLGSINHSLLSIQAIKEAGLGLAGLIFFGELVQTTEEVILDKTGVKKLGGVYPTKKITSHNIHEYSAQFKNLI